jgi:O-antigen/teichoic acid export membrane protein
VSSVKANFLSNLAGSVASAVILVCVTPIYLHYLGADSFGLVGISITLTGLATLLDMGLTPALTRELAKLTATNDGSLQVRTTVRTLEILYAGGAILFGLVAFALLPMLALSWIKSNTLKVDTVQHCLELMAIQLAFQLPLSFYTGGFIGMQRQSLLNILNLLMLAARAIGAVVLLTIFKADVVEFFAWQAVITLVHLCVMAYFLWKILPLGVAVFQFNVLRAVWKYAVGMIGITGLSILLTQLDKIILSRILSLEHFGYYMLAWSIASLLLRPVGPVFNAWLPKMTQLAMVGNEDELVKLYHKGAQIVNLLVVPAAICIAIFSHQILYLYTGSKGLADATATALTVLTIGSACNALMHMPYALTLAYGWTKFAIYQNSIASLVIIPLTYWTSTLLGLSGGGIGWMIVNIGYVIISLHIIHKKYLKYELKKWYKNNLNLYYKQNYFYINKLFKYESTR